MSTHIPNTDRSYRRGAVMGLTIAEAFILIAFALLLLFAFWQWETDQENTEEVEAFKDLSPTDQQTILAGLRDGSMEAFIGLSQRNVDFSAPASIGTPREQWRFIDRDDQRRLMDALVELPEDVQRDLADLVAAENAIAVLRQLSILEDLVAAGQAVDASNIIAADARLAQVSGRIQTAIAQEEALVGALRADLGGIVDGIGGYIDDRGAIILPDAVLFEQGQARITAQMERFLRDACAPWLTTLRNSGIDIAEVKIEGHASSEWRIGASAMQGYLGNLNLSQQRSQTVLRDCLENVGDADVLAWAQQHLIAVGYSSVRPVFRDGQEDLSASRRVVFSVTPDRDSLITAIESDVAIAAE
ncbi:hypothetical protein [Yoonia sp. BS5-3]|uniref:OmpA family protein n=1 Tax=Yoonia phaeophyticola TaxID=3137369 RepID=A0ABZ2VA83_9RHOB